MSAAISALVARARTARAAQIDRWGTELRALIGGPRRKARRARTPGEAYPDLYDIILNYGQARPDRARAHQDDASTILAQQCAIAFLEAQIRTLERRLRHAQETLVVLNERQRAA